MPLYEYECLDHGRFEDFNTVELCQLPVDCPECGSESRRAYTIPRVRQMDKTKVKAMDRNVKSQHQPHVCGSGCSHHHKPKEKKNNGELQQYKGSRPWVIEHA